MSASEHQTTAPDMNHTHFVFVMGKLKYDSGEWQWGQEVDLRDK